MAKRKNPNEVVHVQVAEGETVVYDNIAYGPRATLQVTRGDLGNVKGKTSEVKADEVPDVAKRA